MNFQACPGHISTFPPGQVARAKSETRGTQLVKSRSEIKLKYYPRIINMQTLSELRIR